MEQTRKYGSFACLRSKLLLPVLFCCAFGFSQEASSAHVQKTLMNSFSAPALEAYKENSLGKVTDFYYYLNLLSSSKDITLKTQLKENIIALFADENELLEDFTTEKSDQIPLLYLIENIASREISFSLKNESVTGNTFRDYWLDSYILEVTENNKTIRYQLKQKIYMKPESKSFGNESRQVWQTSLGGIE